MMLYVVMGIVPAHGWGRGASSFTGVHTENEVP